MIFDQSTNRFVDGHTYTSTSNRRGLTKDAQDIVDGARYKRRAQQDRDAIAAAQKRNAQFWKRDEGGLPPAA